MRPRRNVKKRMAPQKQAIDEMKGKEEEEEDKGGEGDEGVKEVNPDNSNQVAGNENDTTDANTQNTDDIPTDEDVGEKNYSNQEETAGVNEEMKDVNQIEKSENNESVETSLNDANTLNTDDIPTDEDVEEENYSKPEETVEITEEMKDENQVEENKNDESVGTSFKVKVSHLPAVYTVNEFQKHIWRAVKIKIDNVFSPGLNSPWLIITFSTKEEQESLIKYLHNHVWRKKALRAVAFHGLELQKRKLEDGEDESDPKKSKGDDTILLSLEEEILSESLPLYSVPYEEQNRFTVLDVEILSNKLHAFMCVRNPALANWAEAMCEKNGGFIYKIEPLKPSPILQGYRNKCKFRIGRNADGEVTVGFCLNDNENKILGVQPGDKLIHLPDSMKYAAKKFEEFIRKSGKEPYDKKQKSGFWDHVIIRLAPSGDLMLVVVMYHNQLSEEDITSIKNDVKNFFENGEGKDCKLFSLYFQVMNDKSPMLPPEKLDLLMGRPSFEENICGLKFYVGPFSILNVNSPSAENIYKSIIELAEPTPETTIIDIGSGTGGIAFTIADKCKQVIAIESQEDNVNDALKTKELNNINNVEFIKGKVENELSGVFEKLQNSPIIPIIDPPRQGLVQKAISLLRSNNNINKLVYVCSNSKMGVKNFLDLCASSEKKEGTFGNPLNVEFSGLPFLPSRAVPVDVSPYTVNNTIIILFERVDPSIFPPAKNPPPVPLRKIQMKKDERKKRRKGQGSKRGKRFLRNKERAKNKIKAIGEVDTRGRGNGRFGGNSRRGAQTGFNNQNRSNRFPPPLMRPMDPALSLVAKYEQRIAELEQQDRAFKAGLTMGLQALGSRANPGPGGSIAGNFGSFGYGNNIFRNLGDLSKNEAFGGLGRGGFKDNFGQFDRDRNEWPRNNDGRNSFGDGFGGNGGIGGSGVGGGGGMGNNFGGNFGIGGFNNFRGGIGFGNFGGGIGAGIAGFSSGPNEGGTSAGGNFRRRRRNKVKRPC